MKRVFKADLFDLRKSKSTYILLLGAVLLGFLLPMMYYGIVVLLKSLSELESIKDNPMMASLYGMIDALDGRTAFFSSLPLSQGFGLMLTPMIGDRAVRPFGTGVYRNKVITRIPRASIYLSHFSICLMLSMYTVVAAFTSRFAFGELTLTGREILVVALLSIGIYLVYTAIPVFIAFLTRSTPLTLIISPVLPILMQTVISLVSPALINAPEAVLSVLAVVPSFQTIYLASATATNAVLIVSLSADVVIAVLLTVFGILRFKRADMN